MEKIVFDQFHSLSRLLPRCDNKLYTRTKTKIIRKSEYI